MLLHLLFKSERDLKPMNRHKFSPTFEECAENIFFSKKDIHGYKVPPKYTFFWMFYIHQAVHWFTLALKLCRFMIISIVSNLLKHFLRVRLNSLSWMVNIQKHISPGYHLHRKSFLFFCFRVASCPLDSKKKLP